MSKKKNTSLKIATSESDLNQQNQELAILLTHIPAYAFFKNTNGVYITASKMFCEALNCTPTEIVGKTDYDLVPKSMADKYHADDMRVITTGEPLYLGEENIISSGKIITVVTRKVPLKDKSGKVTGLLGVGFDVTELKQVQITLQESETRYRTLISTSPDAIIVADLQTKIIMVNSQAVVLYGADSDKELIGKKALDFIIPEDHTRFLENLAIAKSSGRIGHNEYRFYRKDGTMRFGELSAALIHDARGEPNSFIAILRDISDRKKLENELLEEDRFLTSIFSGVQDGISVLDKDLTIIRVNPAMEKWYAHALPLIGKKCYEVYHGRNERCDICPCIQTIKTGKYGYEMVPKIGPDKTLVGWLDLYSYPLLDVTTGELKGVIEYVRDITTKRNAELQQQSLTQGLTAVIEAADELITCSDLDMVYRRAVELGREKLGLERCSLYIEDENIVHGTYGTNQHGKTTDEHNIAISTEQWRQYLQLSTTAKQPWLVFEKPWLEWTGKQLIELSSGWTIATPIRSVQGQIGVFFNDAAITNAPLIPDKQEIIVVYCSLLSSIIERKRAVEALQNSEQEYRATLNAMGDAIHVVDTNLKIILMNQPFLNWLPVIGSECNPIGKTVFEVFPFLPKKVEWEYRSVFETKRMLLTQETNIINNQEIVTETRKIPILEKGMIRYIVTVIRDITEQKHTEVALQKSEETYRSLVENINDVIFTLDLQGKITYISPAIERIAGYTVSDLVGKPFTQLVYPDDLLAILGSLEQSFAGKPIPTEFRLIDRTAMIHYMRGSSRHLIKNNQIWGLIGIMSDITDRKQVEEQLRSLSLIDELTGLYNRRGFLALAEQQIKIAHRLEKRMLLLFSDIDNMKWINDTFGHQEGDRALVEATTVFKETFRESDIIARIGGDEFVILAIEIDASSAEILSQRLQENLDTHNTQATRNYRLAVSTGIVRYVPESPRPLNELLEQADKLMYEQKRKKQNQTQNKE
ncbi:MAG: PAS domain S-box protein [bacterium]